MKTVYKRGTANVLEKGINCHSSAVL